MRGNIWLGKKESKFRSINWIKKFMEHYRVSYIQTGDTYDGNYSAT